MKLHKKKCILYTVVIFMLLTCPGCGKPVNADQMKAVKTGYRIGYVKEEYYRMTLRAYCGGKPMPPVSAVRLPTITTIEKILYQMDCLVNACYSNYFSEYRFPIKISK